MGKARKLSEIIKSRGIRYALHIITQKARQEMEFYSDSRQMHNNLHPLRIAFELSGGMGDYVIAANYLSYFTEQYCAAEDTITLYFPQGLGLAACIFRQTGHLLLREGRQYKHPCSYDIYIMLSRFPRVIFFRERRIRLVCPKLLQYIGICRAFELQHPYFFNCVPFCDGQAAAYCEIIGQKRIQQPDICGFLGIEEKYHYRIQIAEDEERYLDSLHIRSKQFITIHHGCDTKYAGSTKLWPLQNYRKLVHLLRQRYPDLVVVQIGVSKVRFPKVDGVDIYLAGKTNMEQVKVLLKHSLVHIDNEGGLVHMRHALQGGRSVVLFGPTSDRFYGYSENSNLRSSTCPRACEWLAADWSDRCMRQNSSIPACMEALQPELVLERVGAFLDARE